MGKCPTPAVNIANMVFENPPITGMVESLNLFQLLEWLNLWIYLILLEWLNLWTYIQLLEWLNLGTTQWNHIIYIWHFPICLVKGGPWPQTRKREGRKDWPRLRIGVQDGTGMRGRAAVKLPILSGWGHTNSLIKGRPRHETSWCNYRRGYIY